MHLSTQTIKLYSNLLSFSEPLKKTHRILTCGTAENKERFKRKDILCITRHTFMQTYNLGKRMFSVFH